MKVTINNQCPETYDLCVSLLATVDIKLLNLTVGDRTSCVDLTELKDAIALLEKHPMAG